MNIFRWACIASETDPKTHKPGKRGLLESFLHIHVSAVVIGDDEVEVNIFSFSEQFLHVSNQLMHPSSLVFYWKKQVTG